MCLARFKQSHQIITFACATEMMNSINQYFTVQVFFRYRRPMNFILSINQQRMQNISEEILIANITNVFAGKKIYVSITTI